MHLLRQMRQGNVRLPAMPPIWRNLRAKIPRSTVVDRRPVYLPRSSLKVIPLERPQRPSPTPWCTPCVGSEDVHQASQPALGRAPLLGKELTLGPSLRRSLLKEVLDLNFSPMFWYRQVLLRAIHEAGSGRSKWMHRRSTSLTSKCPTSKCPKP